MGAEYASAPRSFAALRMTLTKSTRTVIELEMEEAKVEAKKETWEPKIVAFLCNWCSYAGADLAGVSRLQYPPNIRIIRVPCSGRVNPLFIMRALRQGADGILVSGCHPGDCHYLSGNYYARRKFTLLNSLLEHLGVEKGRVQFSWVSASESIKFAQLIKEVTETVRALGPRNKLVKAGLKK